MEAKIYGVIDSNNCLIDISRSEKGTKRYATKNGFDKIGYRVGYNAIISGQKINNKWVHYDKSN